MSIHILSAASRGVRICAPAFPLVVLALTFHPTPATAQAVALPPVQVDVPTRPRRNTVPAPTAAQKQSGEVVTSPTPP